MVYVSMENQFAFLYDVLRRAMAADPDYKVDLEFSRWCIRLSGGTPPPPNSIKNQKSSIHPSIHQHPHPLI